jgi:hypothetical protein
MAKYRKVSDYTGSAENSKGWKEFSKEHSVSERKPMLKSLVRNIKKTRQKVINKSKAK